MLALLVVVACCLSTAYSEKCNQYDGCDYSPGDMPVSTCVFPHKKGGKTCAGPKCCNLDNDSKGPWCATRVHPKTGVHMLFDYCRKKCDPVTVGDLSKWKKAVLVNRGQTKALSFTFTATEDVSGDVLQHLTGNIYGTKKFPAFYASASGGSCDGKKTYCTGWEEIPYEPFKWTADCPLKCSLKAGETYTFKYWMRYPNAWRRDAPFYSMNWTLYQAGTRKDIACKAFKIVL